MDIKEDSVDEKTLQVDVFGEIKFQGSTTKKAKVSYEQTSSS